jgi:hypothetical protein
LSRETGPDHLSSVTGSLSDFLRAASDLAEATEITVTVSVYPRKPILAVRSDGRMVTTAGGFGAPVMVGTNAS